MVSFSYYNPTRIVFGKDVIKDVGALAAGYGRKVLFHYGSGSIKKNGVYDQVIASLADANLEVVELGGVVPNPRLSLVLKGIEICRREQIDCIIAVGGGSVIDSAKAIGFGACISDDEDIWDDYYMNSSCVVRKTIPVGVVLTIPAAGSESSDGSVITNDENGLKRSVNSETIIPRFAVMDPQTNYTLPAYQAACGASDILAHLQERYFTSEKYNDLSDRLLESAMRNVISNAPLARKHPDSYRYRAELMWTGTIAHNNLLDRGRIGDWASHAIEHELSGRYDIAHGAGLSIIFPAWMRYVYQTDIDRFVQYAIRVWDIGLPLDDKETVVFTAIEHLEAFYRSLGLPVRLHEAGIGEEHLDKMAKTAMIGRAQVGTFQSLHADDIEKIYRLAL